MWMMGYSEAEDMNINMNMNMVDSYTNNGSSRKLRPLVPRPPPATNFHLHHHHHLGEPNKREFSSQQMVVVSSRWNPTPEQLQTLEELYRRGTRTPSADEIQHITAQLRQYGKIEGKNVFYWFQNHKARERQKRRRQLDNSMNHHHHHQGALDVNTDEGKDSVAEVNNRTCHEVDETRNWAIPTFSERRVWTTKAESRMIDQAWQPIEEEEGGGGSDQLQLHHRRRKSFPERNPMWIPPTNHIINISSAICTTALPSDTLKHHQTLELFPVNTNTSREHTDKCLFPTIDVTPPPPPHFIEFLPLKN